MTAEILTAEEQEELWQMDHLVMEYWVQEYLASKNPMATFTVRQVTSHAPYPTWSVDINGKEKLSNLFFSGIGQSTIIGRSKLSYSAIIRQYNKAVHGFDKNFWAN